MRCPQRCTQRGWPASAVREGGVAERVGGFRLGSAAEAGRAGGWRVETESKARSPLKPQGSKVTERCNATPVSPHLGPGAPTLLPS
eukprot:scaffold11940_cov106-Isochrysis_galbana.AAC.1